MGIMLGAAFGGIAVWYIMRKKCDFNPTKGSNSSKGIASEIFDPFLSIDDSPDGNYPATYGFRSAIRMY